MSDSDAKHDRSGSGHGTTASSGGVHASEEGFEIDLEEGGDEAVPLPSPRNPVSVDEIDAALGALEPMPSVVVKVPEREGPVPLPSPRPSVLPAKDEDIELALGALEPMPSVVVKVPEPDGPVPLPGPASGGGRSDDEIDLALGALEPEPSLLIQLGEPAVEEVAVATETAAVEDEDALGAEEPAPSLLIQLEEPVVSEVPVVASQDSDEMEIALGALEPEPSWVIQLEEPVVAEVPVGASEDSGEGEIALGALEPEPSLVIELEEPVAEAPVAAEQVPVADENALGAEAPAPSLVIQLEEPGDTELPGTAEDFSAGVEAGADPAVLLAAAASVVETEVSEITGESGESTHGLITSDAPETQEGDDMGAIADSQPAGVGEGGPYVPTQELLRSLVPGMVRAAAAILGPSDPDLDDVVQQSLIGFVQALPGFRGECGPTRFASRIVVRTACAAKRRRALQASRRVDDVDVDSLQDGLPSQHAELAAERRRVALRELLADIPEEQAETLSLRVVFGFSLEEVAETTGVPVNTVRSRVRLAKEALRNRIDRAPALRELLEVES
jgi:RNA polymerase sigma-70 factor (ECF subfamily)